MKRPKPNHDCLRTFVLTALAAGLGNLRAGPLYGQEQPTVRRPKVTLNAQDVQPHGVELSADGGLLASYDGARLRLWDTETGKPKWSVRAILILTMAPGVLFSPDGETLASSEQVRRGVGACLREVRSGRIKHVLRTSREVSCMVFAPDARTLAVADEDGTIGLWDPKTGRRQVTLEKTNRAIYDMAFSPPGDTLAVASVGPAIPAFPSPRLPAGGAAGAQKADVTIDLWDTQYAKKRATLDCPDRTFFHFAFSPDGKMLASSGDQAVTLWSAETGKRERTLGPHGGPGLGQNLYRAMAFSPDARALVLGSPFQLSIGLWDFETGRFNQTVAVSRDQLTLGSLIAISPSGRMVTASSRETPNAIQFKLWDPRTGRHLATLEPSPGPQPFVVEDHGPGGRSSLLFSQDEKTLAAVAIDGTVALWDIEGCGSQSD